MQPTKWTVCRVLRDKKNEKQNQMTCLLIIYMCASNARIRKRKAKWEEKKTKTHATGHVQYTRMLCSAIYPKTRTKSFKIFDFVHFKSWPPPHISNCAKCKTYVPACGSRLSPRHTCTQLKGLTWMWSTHTLHIWIRPDAYCMWDDSILRKIKSSETLRWVFRHFVRLCDGRRSWTNLWIRIYRRDLCLQAESASAEQCHIRHTIDTHGWSARAAPNDSVALEYILPLDGGMHGGGDDTKCWNANGLFSGTRY